MSDSFLSSMTFAGNDFRANAASCDCDECGVDAEIPLPILAALRERKRQKLEHGPIKRTQARSLIQRGPDNVAVWHWIFPQAAEPLVEFGSTHRIVWVKRLPKSNIVRSIGKGIIGSSDEERSRNDTNWEEGGVYLVPSNGGKAVGWIHHAYESSGDDDTSKLKHEGHAELLIAKVSLDRLRDVRFIDDIEASVPPWVSTFVQHCRKGIEKLDEEKLNDRDTTGDYTCHEYRSDDCSALKEAFLLAENPPISSHRSSVPEPNNPTQSSDKQGGSNPASLYS